VPPEVQEVIDRYFNLDALQRVFSQEQWMKIGKSVMSGTWSVLGGTLSAIATLVSWLLALLYMFFVMIDYDKIGHGFKSAVPPRYRRKVFRIMSDVTGTMSRYFRGQALVSFFVGIVFAIEFYIIGLPMAVVFGLSIGVLNMVPYLQLISIPVAAFLCLVKSVSAGVAFLPLFGWTIAAYFICQAIQDMVLTPTIMKQQMGLRPAIIFLALSIWSYVLGFIGLIIALPLTTLIISYYSEYVLHVPNPLHRPKGKDNNTKVVTKEKTEESR
jgi:predicted PurR-regulated permease PerM